MGTGATAIGVAAAAIGLVIGTAPAASANDVDLNWIGHAGLVQHGRWVDADDTLCARTQGYKIRVRIVPVSGLGRSFSVDAYNLRVGSFRAWVCTPNLRLPEDARYRMELWSYPTGGGGALTFRKSVLFYS